MKTLHTILLKYYIYELAILGFAAFSRFFRLGTPSVYVFDEVYHAFTAQEMVKGNPAAWEWWNTPPAGVAYEWTHPPLSKLFMVLSINVFGDTAFAWRFFSAFFGVGIIILVYFLARKLFNNRILALFAALVAAADGLLLVMSRIAMNDNYLIFFSLLALLAFLYNKKFLMAISLGCAVASKWTGFYAIGIIGVLYIIRITAEWYNLRKLDQDQIALEAVEEETFTQKSQTKSLSTKRIITEILLLPLLFILIPAAIYLAAYIPFLTGNHIPPDQNWNSWQAFAELQRQMWWYHTNLNASHDYQSTPWEWVLNLRPVWFWVDYKDTTVANIYALGNPLVMWFGLISIAFVLYDFVRRRSMDLLVILVGYFGFFLPWVISPRIMFFYHYTPAVPFLALASGYVLYEFLGDKVGRVFITIFCILLLGFFIYFYPLLTGMHVPKCPDGSLPNCLNLYESYFWFKSWK